MCELLTIEIGSQKLKMSFTEHCWVHVMISGLELLLLISAGVIILLILGLITVGTFLLRRMKEKEVATVPCSNCGESMPQTAIFCPNCGARRKS